MKRKQVNGIVHSRINNFIEYGVYKKLIHLNEETNYIFYFKRLDTAKEFKKLSFETKQEANLWQRKWDSKKC